MWGNILRCIMLVPFAPLLFAFIYVAFFYVVQTPLDQIQSFLIAFLIAFPLWIILLSSVKFWRIFGHEMSHVVLVKLTGRRMVELAVNTKGESYAKYLPSSNALIRLAPYYFPFFSLPFLLVKPFVIDAMDDIFNALIGTSLAFHYVTVLFDLGLHQTDITDTGICFSIILTLVLNVIILVIVLAVVLTDYGMILDYFADSFNCAATIYSDIWQAWQSGAIEQEFNNFVQSIGS